MTPEQSKSLEEDIEEEEEQDENPSVGRVLLFDIALWFILGVLCIYEFAGYGGMKGTGLKVRFLVFSLCYAGLFFHAFYLLGYIIQAFKRGESNDAVVYMVILFIVLMSLLFFGGMGFLYLFCMSGVS